MLERLTTLLTARSGLARAWPVLIAAALALASCGDNTPDTINSQIEGGDATGALNALAPLLEQSPADPTLNLLALKATLAQCIELRCPTDKPDMLASITKYMGASTQPVKINDTTTLDAATVLAAAADGFAALPNQPVTILTMLPVVPEASRTPYINALFNRTVAEIRENRTAPALETLRQMANADKQIGLANAAWSGLMHSLLGNQRNRAESYLISLRANQKGHTLPPAALALVPHALFASLTAEKRPNATELFTQTLTPLVQGWELPTLVDDAALGHMGSEINRMRTNTAFLTRALKYWPGGEGAAVVTTLSGTTVLASPGAELQFELARLSLGLNPDQPDLWAEFLPLAKPFIQKGGDLSALASALQGRKLPTDVQDAYLSILFQLIDSLSKKGLPFLPVLEQTGSIAMDKAAATKLEKLVQTGLEKAIAAGSITDIIGFATFKPEIARNNRQALVPLVVEAVREALRKNDFDTATDLANFLQKTMVVDFNMDALILQEFDNFVQQSKLADNLSADTAEWLLQPQAAATIDIGPLFTFMQEYFAAKPEIINSQLRTLVGLARGQYGVPTAVYRLFPLFDDKQFPPDQREQYLVASLQTALMDDEKLSGPQLADLAGRLHRLHPKLVLPPVVENALDRCTSLEDSRKLWETAPADLRKALEAVRPQYTSLMQGIDAFNHGHRTRAAEQFAKLTGPVYIAQAESYLAQLITQLADITGIYAPADTVKGASKPATLLVVVNVPSLGAGSSAEMPINQVELTLVNQLGSSVINNPEDLTSSHATISRFTVPAEFDFDSGKVELTDETKAAVKGGSGFDGVFGPLTQLTFSKAASQTTLALVAENDIGSKVTLPFQRLYRNPQTYTRPDGRYSITSAFAGPANAAGTILPVGSIIEITAENAFGSDMPTSLPISGKLWHPASSSPLKFTGTYTPATAVSQFTFAYPLPGSGSLVKAQTRCQTVPGTILCGSHFLHSARQQYSQLVEGKQTRESLAERDNFRNILNREYKIDIKQAVKNLPRNTSDSFLDDGADKKADDSILTSETSVLSTSTPTSTSEAPAPAPAPAN